MPEDASSKVAQSIVRLVAFCLVLVSLMFYAEDLFLYLSHKPVSSTGRLVLKGIPFLLGLVVFVRSRALADRISDYWE